MKKFLLLLCALLGTVVAWATDVTLTPANGTYVTSSGNYVNSITFSTEPAITVTASANNMDKRQTGEYLLWHSGSSGSSTYTISVGGDYVITSYSVTGEANTSAQTLTAGSNSHEFAVGTSSTFTVTDLEAPSVSFVQTGANASGLKITSISVTMKVVPVVKSLSELSNNKAYYVTTNDRGAWFVPNEGSSVTSTTKAGFASSMSDVKQQFAFLTYGTTGVYHLYSISEGKFVSKSGQYTTLTSELGDNVTLLTGTGNANYPFVVALQDGAYHMGISNGYDPAVITFWNSLTDAGNQVQIREVADFDPTAAMAILEAVYSTTVTVTYAVYDGETLVESQNAVQDKNSAVSIPAALLKNTWYYDYTASGTIGETDCTITVARTYKSGVVTSLSGLSNNKAYTLVTERGTFTTDNGALANTCKTGSNYTVYNFAIVNYENAYYLWSVQDGKFVAGNQTELTETPAAITMNALDEPLFKIQCGSNYLNCNTNSGGFFSTWSTTDGGNRVAIIEAADFDPTAALTALDEYFHPAYVVTYVVKDTNGNTIFTSDPVGTELGATITSLPEEFQRDFCTYNTVNVTISQPSTTVEFTATFTGLPFTLSPSYDDATWYNMNIRGTKYVSKGETEPYALATATLAQKAEDEYRWAFSGNPYALVVYNKASGSSNTLTKDGDNAVLRSGTYTWTLCKNSDGFTLKVTGTDNTYVNDVNSTLKFWNNASAATDNGSTFRVETVVDNYYDMVKAEVLPYIFADTEDLVNSDPAASIGKPFGIKLETVEYIVETYGAQLLDQNFNLTDYKAIVGVKDAGIIYPENGKFYIIKNVSNGKYLNVKSDHGIYADADTPTASSIVQAIIRDDKTYFATQGLEFGWCYTASYPALLDAAGSGKYAYFSLTAPGQVAFAHVLGNGEGSTYEVYTPLSYYTVGDDNQVVGGPSTAAAAQWTFEEATSVSITLDNPIDDKYYATLCVPYDVTIDGATAYTVTKGEGTVLTTTEITDGVVAAGTPVLLVGESASATATIGENYSTAISTETALTGSYLEVANFDGATNYVLGNDGTKAGFFHKDVTTLTTNSAYIAGDESSSIEAFYFEADDIIGDVNNDGSVTIADVTALVNIILGKDTEGAYNHDAADVNNDGNITIADVTALVNIILGKNN